MVASSQTRIEPKFINANSINVLEPKATCRNLKLGLATKAKGACKVAGQEEARESHRIFLHTRKATPTLGDGISMNS